MFARVAVAIVLLAGVASGIQVEPAVAQPSSAVKTVEKAMRKLEAMWPGIDGKKMLEDITAYIPPKDEGAELQNRLFERFDSHSPFVFASFGSSVSAGHDNNMNQSWPFELERLLKPTFQDLGFDFDLRQRAAGGYGEMPFAAGCMESRAGGDLDAVSWEWHMFYDDACEGQHFLSEAAAIDGRPMVFAFADSSVDFNGNMECTENADERGCADARRDFRSEVLANDDNTFGMPREWKPSEWYFGEKFVSAAELAKFRQGAPSKFKPKSYIRSGKGSVWLQSKGVAQPFESEGGAFYPISVSAATKHVINDPWYQAREKAFNVNWHPGPMGHTLIASGIAHYMLSNLKIVLKGGPTTRSKGPSLDNPLVGDPEAGAASAQCAALKSLKCKTGMHPAVGGNYVDTSKDARSSNTWEYQVSRQSADARVPTVDERWVYRGTRNDGELKLQVKTDAADQYLVVCGAPCGWKCNGNAGYVSSRSQRWWGDNGPSRKEASDLKFTIDGREVPNAELLKLHDELFSREKGRFCPGCKNPADLCQPVAKVGAGDHTIGARVSPSSRPAVYNDEEMFVEVFEIMVVG